MKRGKKYRAVAPQVDRLKKYPLEEALQLVKSTSYVNFDSTLDIAVNLAVNPKYADQMVRGAVVLPNGLGKTVKVLVFAQGEKEKEALDAGADFVGAEEFAEKIKKGWLGFDKVLATPDMMRHVGKLGKILGPRGLMPNPKVGTVTKDIARSVKEMKAGRVEYRVDKAGIIHAGVGKVSFDEQSLKENVTCLIEALIKAKPASAKGNYLKNITLASSMGLGIKVDTVKLQDDIKENQ